MRALCILCVRNEGAHLLDWLAHHRAVGFTEFLVFSNDCADGTEMMLERLQGMGELTHIRNDDHGARGPQWAALKAADRHPLKAGADWILCLDIDEFVNIHAGDGTLSALFAAVPQATAIPLTWRLFGNAGVVAIEDAPVAQTFIRAAPAVLHWPWRAALFKTLFRNDGTYGALGVHRPRRPEPARLHTACWVDGSGRPLDDGFRTTRIYSDFGQDNHRLVQLNHYALGSMQGYLVKCDRGRANREGAPLDMGYWIDRNFCAVEDASIRRMAPATESIRARFMADAPLAAMHRQAVLWRQERFRQLMREEPWRALYGRLMMTPPTRVLGPQEARQIWQFGQKNGTPA